MYLKSRRLANRVAVACNSTQSREIVGAGAASECNGSSDRGDGDTILVSIWTPLPINLF
jgi:hypothetical protein